MLIPAVPWPQLCSATRRKVKFVPLSSPQRFTALQSGEIDILSRNTTWTLTRDASQGAVFAAINYYDGQGFMVPKKLGVKSAKQLNGATVCLAVGHEFRSGHGRLLCRQQHEVQAGYVRYDRSHAERLHFRSPARSTRPT